MLAGVALTVAVLGLVTACGKSDGSESAAAPASAAPSQSVPALLKAFEACGRPNYTTLGDRGGSMTIDGDGDEGPGTSQTDTLCILRSTQMPDYIQSKIGATRALDGQTEAEWPGIKASWTYHPDEGLDMVLVDTTLLTR